MTCVRFAPVLTGPVLVAGARVALANWTFARRGHGRVLLRLDDLAIKDPAIDPVLHDLRWLGIEWHETVRQSERRARYEDVFARLQREGFLYPCFETEEELRAKAEFRRKRGQPAVYDRAMLRLTAKQRADAEAGGKRPHWRFKLSGRVLEWRDMIQGKQQAALTGVSDPVLMQGDGTPTPLFASLVDDVDLGVTHVIRGEDSTGATAATIELLEVLGRPGVRFAHLPALAGEGRAVASQSVRALRGDGIEPSALVACLVGWSDAEARPFRLPDMADIEVDAGRLLAANRTALKGLTFADVADRLPPGATEAFWLAVRGKLDLLREAKGWWDVVAGQIVPPVIEGERDLLLEAAALLPTEPWDAGVWAAWLAALEHATGRPADALIEPLRLALTGEDTGPDLADLLPLIGRTRAANRLAIAAA